MLSAIDYQVLTAIIEDQFLQDGADHLCIDKRVYPQNPGSGVSFNRDIECFREYHDLFADWRRDCPENVVFESSFGFKVEYDLWQRGEPSPYKNSDGQFSWNRLYEQHPSSAGLIDCSSVKCADTGNLWIAHIGCLAGGKTGAGHIYYYEGPIDNLRFRDKFRTWVS